MKKIATYQISLKCFLKNSLWETLILKTPITSSFLWTYDFVGWRIDEDEFEVDYVDILKREIFEEIWIKNVEIKKEVVSIARHKALKKFTKSWQDDIIFYVFFEWKIIDENIQISHEHIDYKFVKLEEIDVNKYFYSWYLEAVKMYLWIK